MKVSVIRARCEGHGLCEDAAPDLFRVDDDGELVSLFDEEQPVPEEFRDQAVKAVRVCPIAALSVTDRPA
ncbi:ferredoxin [Streptomyces sp. NPDC058326]|uniref:ferredoxin n=1 Tax=Streptomyces sp. NPDC058326 TaxID=3346447 RepID=UPI0036EBDA56